jgi:ankyrin repeat protein
MIELLTAAGADVNAKADDGSTPLHWAVRQEADAAIAALLALPMPDIFAEANDGKTPVSWVQTPGYRQRFEALIQQRDIDRSRSRGNRYDQRRERETETPATTKA